jgi:hypothetical protein
MRDEKRPIEIDGKTYLVDRTFSDDPVIYKVVGKDRFDHVYGGQPTIAKVITAGLEPGQVIIIAHTV